VPEPTYPYGYARPPGGGAQGMGTMFTMAQCEQQYTIRQGNFEFWRRTRSMMQGAHVAGVPLGVGAMWRVQPTNGGPGFASPGNSNHEGFPADGRSGGAVAADMVPDFSWPWMEANCAAYGLRTFKHVNGEPWHIQPTEIPAGRNKRREPWVLQAWNVPNPGVPSGADVFGIFPEQNKYGLYPYQSWRDKPGVLVGMRDSDLRPNPNTGHIWYAQAVVKHKMGQPAMKIDGMWGNVSGLYFAAKIGDWNAFTGDRIPVQTGIGYDQWRLIDAYAKDFQNLIP
jgi:hypothetical protein